MKIYLYIIRRYDRIIVENSRTAKLGVPLSTAATVLSKVGKRATTRYRRCLRYTQDYFTLNKNVLQVDYNWLWQNNRNPSDILQGVKCGCIHTYTLFLISHMDIPKRQ